MCKYCHQEESFNGNYGTGVLLFIFESDNRYFIDFEDDTDIFEIFYCPMCGEKLGGENLND